jgi:acetylornithine deacetylase/succinyl-diaminopimelate desuccinylase family protein
VSGPEDLVAAIRASGWERLLAELVRTPSHPGIARQEERVAATLAAWLREHGVEAELDEAAPGRPNLIARLEGPKPGRTLVLCGHTDTVPLNAGDPGAGFSGEIRDGRLWGRGACDMKGALAAMAASLAALSSIGALRAGAVVLAAVVDEEMESLGAERLVATGFAADGAIVGEPTGNLLALGHKGLEWIEVSFTGRAAHGGTPEAGINAIAAASRFCCLIGDELRPALARRPHPVLGPPTINLGTIRGGDQPSTVAASCVVTLDRRTVPGESWAGVAAELRLMLDRVEAESPGLATAIRRVPGGMATLEHLSTVVDEDHPLARAVESARVEATGRADVATVFPAWTDAALLANFAAIPCVVLGPGDLALAHSPRENVPLAEVAEAALIYSAAAVRFTAPGDRA